MPWFVHSILCFLDLTVIMHVAIAYSFELCNVAFNEYVKIHLSILLSMDIENICHFSCYYKQDIYAYSFTSLQLHIYSISFGYILLNCREFACLL